MQPKARAGGLVVQELEGELLVYDLASHRAHCLNPSAAAVWRACDGRKGVMRLRDNLAEQMGTPVDEEFVWLALRQLSRADLLETRVALPARQLTRRAVARRLGLATGTAILLPLIVSPVSPTPAMAASGACVPPGGTCQNATDTCCDGGGPCIMGMC